MGVNVGCQLPHGTRIKDVAKVAAALLGHESKHVPIGGSDSTFATVKGYDLKAAGDSSFQVTLAYVVLDTTTGNPAAQAILKSDGERYHLLYHFEYSKLGPGTTPKCTAAKIALCVGLVRFFGGTVDFSDCDAKDVNLRVKAKTDIHASDGPEWSEFQNRILAVQPITKDDIAKYEKFAAY